MNLEPPRRVEENDVARARRAAAHDDHLAAPEGRLHAVAVHGDGDIPPFAELGAGILGLAAHPVIFYRHFGGWTVAEIRVGPAGWSYEDWKGKVYPEPPPPGFDALAFLARHFDCLEINTTFYRPPAARMAESWARRTPDGFLFTVKAWEKFSHDKEPFTAPEVRLFLDGIAPLSAAGRVGALLLQFPWFFRDSPQARDRLRRAADALAGPAPLVVEVRHRSWLDALDFLKGLRLNFCNIDQPRSTTALTGTSHVTGPVGYVRLHGRNAKAWFDKNAGRDEKYDYLYSPEELRGWVEAAQDMETEKTFVIANNHFQGKAVVNALQLKRALGQAVEAPEPLKSAYPEAWGSV